MVLTETFSVQNAAIGVLISGLALYLTHRFFHIKKQSVSFKLIGHYVIYVLFLVFQILRSAMVSAICIFDKHACIRLIRYRTTLSGNYLKSMLASAITLTPGTVTADIKGDVLEVLKLGKAGGKSDNAAIEKLERLLKRMDRGEQ